MAIVENAIFGYLEPSKRIEEYVMDAKIKVMFRFGQDLFMGRAIWEKIAGKEYVLLQFSPNREINNKILKRLFIRANRNGFKYENLYGIKGTASIWPLSSTLIEFVEKINKLYRAMDMKQQCLFLNGHPIPPIAFTKIKAKNKWCI